MLQSAWVRHLQVLPDADRGFTRQMWLLGQSPLLMLQALK